MQKAFLVAACAAAIASLAACGEPEVVQINKADPQAEALKNRPAVSLPPSIAAQRQYRCRDNSLVTVLFYTDNTAELRREGSEPVRLTAEGGNPPFTAEGYSVSANAEEVQITRPGAGAQSCRA